MKIARYGILFFFLGMQGVNADSFTLHLIVIRSSGIFIIIIIFYLTFPRLTNVGQYLIILQGLLVSGATRTNAAGCHVSFITIISLLVLLSDSDI